ncbi:hypothetical protein KKJ09_03440 [Xenorhabdus bovienii]|uniref:hypothetical protein n=1 Tax=Xenorhabdus bovienii TaxID=40576 RepID=UPI0023B2F4F8|nr:hypothetical protein [Xenorhabdus bovienii]MDE9492678.1 hypothetical protein [Xenorhabdus bovienii]MDE9501205.1 hypothetical protein [Xenorhabdus bovienii]MDE9526384.1 hypothetical protein [Xenorhabdus bovienii]MDE9569812.1 hypothetical protein [Xenorhabdus bovienii]
MKKETKVQLIAFSQLTVYLGLALPVTLVLGDYLLSDVFERIFRGDYSFRALLESRGSIYLLSLFYGMFAGAILWFFHYRKLITAIAKEAEQQNTHNS